MFNFDFAAGRPWRVALPTVVRYLETQFVEQFVETGTLRIATFGHYVKIEDGDRRDEREGKANYLYLSPTLQIAGIQDAGVRSYVLCGSLSESSDLMENFNKCDNFLRITNPIAFADAVSRYIPGFVSGHIGPCVYRPAREINGSTSKTFGLDLMRDALNQGKVDSKELEAVFERARSQMGADVTNELQFQNLFLKEERFAKECEYRIVWNVAHELGDTFFVTCPEALSFCEVGIETDNTKNKRYKPKEYSSGTVLTTSRAPPTSGES